MLGLMSDDDASDDDDFEYEGGPPTIGPGEGLSGEGLGLTREDLFRLRDSQRERQGILVVVEGNSADIGMTRDVEGALTIGRETGDLPLHDARVSRRHASIVQRDETYLLVDVGSTNGTLLNGEPLEATAALRHGDKIIVGDSVIEFQLVDATAAQYMRRMEQMVATDPLTGLMAKPRFDAAFEQAFRAAAHAGHPISVLMMDMDRLKKINDAMGHHTGADTISRVGRLIGRLLEGRAEACRFGGDEFTAFIPSVHLSTAMDIAEEIRRAVETADLPFEAAPVKATISIGAAVVTEDTPDVRSLIGAADQALYRAKAAGRNAVRA